MNVIVTDTHTRMALAVIRELGQAGYTVISVTRHSKPSLGHASRYTQEQVTLPDDGYADALLALAGSMSGSEKAVLLPAGMHTLNLAAERRGEFKTAFYCLLPELENLHRSGEKPIVMEMARSLGMLTPEVYAPDKPQFPCVIKYINGEALHLHAEKRYKIIYAPDGYEQALAAMRKNGPVFVSQYIPGGAYGVSAVLDENSKPLRVFCHRRVREYPVSGGPACCAESFWHDRLAETGLRLLTEMKLQGFAMAEFKGTPEQPYVLEINPRIWGTYPLSRLSGAGMAEAYVSASLSADETNGINDTMGIAGADSPPISCLYQTGTRMQYLANDLMHALTCLRTRKPTEGNVWLDFLSPKVKGGVFSWRDLPGTLAYIKGLLGRVTH